MTDGAADLTHRDEPAIEFRQDAQTSLTRIREGVTAPQYE